MPTYVLNQLPLFQGLSPGQVDELSPLFLPYECHAGTVIFEQDEPALHLFVVISGEVAIQYKPDDGQKIIVARVRPGGIVGWSAVIGRRLYTSAAVCTEHCEMLRVRGADLQSLCENQPETGLVILNRLADVIGERIHSTQPQLRAILENGLRNGIHLSGG